MLFLINNISFANNKDQIIKDFSNLSQDEKRSALAVMIDGIEHEMFGFGVAKNVDDLKKYGGLPGYRINHYSTYDSGGLVMPVLRVYNANKKLVDTIIGGAILKDGKKFHHIGGFSKPYDFAKVRINGEIVDKMEVRVRRDVMKNSSEKLTANQAFYTPEFMQKLKNEDFINVQKKQDILSSQGYDVSCLAAAIRETKEETGMILNPEEMILLEIFNEIRDQQTSRGYKIQAQVTGACYFMFEAGSVYLDKSDQVESIKLNEKAILNTDKIVKNLNIKHITLKGFDDSDNGIVFISKNSLKKISDKDRHTAYLYNATTWDKKTELNAYMLFGNAMNLVPEKDIYKTCKSLEFITAGSIVPSPNKIKSWEEISKVKINMLC